METATVIMANIQTLAMDIVMIMDIQVQGIDCLGLERN